MADSTETRGIRVTSQDLQHPEDSESVEIMDDYVIVCAGSCHVADVQSHANGTHVITIRGRR